MSAASGTGTLVRLALRQDRVRIPVWAVALGLMVLGTVPALEAAYPTASDRASRAQLMSNPSAIVMAGPGYGIEDYTLGAMVANEISLTLIVAVSIMSVLMVVRHTRTEEESGRAELVRAAAVGRSAPAVAALITTAIANLLVSLLIWVGLVGNGLEMGDSALLAIAVGVTGVTFGAISLVAAQVTEHARAASGIGMAVLCIAFLLRAIGDVQVQHGGTLSWLSPIGWAQQTRPFAGGRWWPLLLSVALAVAALWLAHALGARRDFAAGLLPQRPGRASAKPSLAGPFTLAWRQAWPSFVGWTIGIVVGGAAFGSLIEAMITELADNPLMNDLMGGEAGAAEAMFALFLPYLVLAAIGYALTGVTRLRAEESEGRAEIVLAGPVGRHRWLAANLAVTAVSATAALVLGGLTMGATGAAATGDASWTGRVAAASLGYVPALLLVLALAALLFGAWPRLTALVWVLVAWMIVSVVLGALLDLPEQAMWVSPIAQTPAAPQEAMDATPLVIMSAATLILTALALATFRRRDVPTT